MEEVAPAQVESVAAEEEIVVKVIENKAAPVQEEQIEIVASVEVVEEVQVTSVQQVTDSSNEQPIVPSYPTKTTSERKPVNVSEQSVHVGNCTRRLKGYEDALVSRLSDDIPTAYHSFKVAVEKYGDRPCLGYRPVDTTGKAGPFNFLTYKQSYERIKNFASGLRHLGVNPNQHVGLYSKNRIEWQIASEACHTQSMVTIALYDTLGEESSLYLMNHGEIACLCISAEIFAQVKKFASKCEYLKNLVVFDTLTEEIKNECAKLNLLVYSMDQVEEKGKERFEDVIPEASSLATIMYTSGTTGTPKGVMLTHTNVIAAISGVSHTLLSVTDQDVLISYLPLAHILERVAELLFFQQGAAIGYTQGILKELLDDIQALRPTYFPAVPRVLDRFYERITNQVASGSSFKKWLFNKAMESKRKTIGTNKKPSLAEKIVIGKMKKILGGRVRGMLSGGAPLNPKVHEFLRCAFDCSIVQGYGLTETAAASTIGVPEDLSLAQIGPPLACCEIKLISVPEMNYLTTNEEPSGEIMIRGPNVSIGYYKEPEKTAEVFDKDGWFHTGDVGKFNHNGTLSVIDRVKNIFKLSQGYVYWFCLC
jgi:long-chain acyl-CoA synthetase